MRPLFRGSSTLFIVHCGSTRQTASIVAMNREHLRTGDKASCRFRFIKNPEYIRPDTRMVFREGRTKAVGSITKIHPYIPGTAMQSVKQKSSYHHHHHHHHGTGVGGRGKGRRGRGRKAPPTSTTTTTTGSATVTSSSSAGGSSGIVVGQGGGSSSPLGKSKSNEGSSSHALDAAVTSQ